MSLQHDNNSPNFPGIVVKSVNLPSCNAITDPTNDDDNQPLTIQDLIKRVPEELERCRCSGSPAIEKVRKLVQRTVVSPEEVSKYAMFDRSGAMAYTRNLVATDGATFQLLFLCWNPKCSSLIHDHPCDGGWVKGIQGEVYETVYKENKDGSLTYVQENHLTGGGVTYIDNGIGVHQVSNRDSFMEAITMHLYTPPYQHCRVWPSAHSSNSYTIPMAFFSKFGQRVEL